MVNQFVIALKEIIETRSEENKYIFYVHKNYKYR